MTHHAIIFNWLLSLPGWVPSYRFDRVEISGAWVSHRGDRSARELAANDCDKKYQDKVMRKMGTELLAEGITKDAFGESIVKKYAYFCAKQPTRWDVWRTPDGVVRKREPVY